MTLPVDMPLTQFVQDRGMGPPDAVVVVPPTAQLSRMLNHNAGRRPCSLSPAEYSPSLTARSLVYRRNAKPRPGLWRLARSPSTAAS